MLTGVEIAGLVLAVVPILIEGLTKWAAALPTTKRVLGSKKERQKLARKIRGLVKSLEFHQDQVTIDLRILMLRASPTEEIGALPKDYKDIIWTGPLGTSVDEYLKALGGDSAADSFRGAIELFHDVVTEIAEQFEHYLRPTGVSIKQPSSQNLTFVRHQQKI